MKFFPAVLFVCMLLSVNIFAVDTTSIVYNDFSDLSALQLNGDCKSATNSENRKILRLTSDTTSQSGSAFIKNPIQLISENGFMASFSAYFSFQISNTGGLNEGDGAGADGLVFVIQTVANNVGSIGGGLGYRGIRNSFGVEFDTWNNTDSAQDPDHNHVGIDTNGNTQSVNTYSEKTLFNNGKIWYAWIDYDGDNQTLEIRYDSLNIRPDTPKLTQKLNLPALLVQENVYVGFTSATGLSYNTHDILSFNFVNKFQPYIYAISLSVRPDTTVDVYDSVYLVSTVRDMSNNVQPDSSEKTQWRIIDAGGNSSSILKSSSGSEVLLIPDAANSQIQIEGSAQINNQTLRDTITIHVRQADSYTLEITAAPDTIVQSHSTVTLAASIYNSARNLLSDTAQKTVWKILTSDGNPESILQSNTGATVSLVPLIPYSIVTIEASVVVKNQTLADTIRIHITAGAPCRIIIESAPIVDNTSFLREAHPLESVTLSNYPDDASVYAVVRDQWGGYCRMADSINTNWQVLSGSDIISVNGTDHQKYIGKVTRSGPQGEALIEVSEENLQKDSLPIIAANLFISKIVIRDRESGKTLDSVIAKVKQSRILDVYGLIAGSDPQLESSWVLVEADWSLSGSIQSLKNPLPTDNETWELVANTSGQGTLTVVSSDGVITNENSIPVTILSEIAPYLTRAVYYPSSASNAKSELKIYFSEDVDLSMLGTFLPENTLVYSSSEGRTTGQILGGAVYTISNEQFGTVMTIQAGDGANAIIPDLDSISILSGTVNRNSIAPDKENPKKVPVEIQGGSLTVAVSSNPVNLQTSLSILSQSTRTFYNNVLKENNGQGVIIAIHSSIPLQSTGASYGTATIYDPLGNIVCNDLQIKQANSTTNADYGIYWDGTNKNQRTVGPGTYLARINTVDIKGKARALNIKIGVVSRDL